MRRCIFILLGLMTLGSVYGYAQQGPERERGRGKRPSREEITQQKRAYLVRELSLTDKEADGLMPILEELDTQRFRMWKGIESTRHRIHAKDSSLTDEELRKYFEQELDNKVKEAELERTYFKRCRDILPLNKLVRLERANRHFAQEFFRRAKRDH